MTDMDPLMQTRMLSHVEVVRDLRWWGGVSGDECSLTHSFLDPLLLLPPVKSILFDDYLVESLSNDIVTLHILSVEELVRVLRYDWTGKSGHASLILHISTMTTTLTMITHKMDIPPGR